MMCLLSVIWSEGGEEEEVIEELFECVACDKVFKSENSYISHQKTKKHLKAMEELRFALDLEDELLFNPKDGGGGPDGDGDGGGGDVDGDWKQNEQRKVDGMIAQQMAHRLNVENIESDGSTESEPADRTKNDHLIAVELEQEDIIEAVSGGHLLDDVDGVGVDKAAADRVGDGHSVTAEVEAESAGISEQEILSLLQHPEVDLEALLVSNPELTVEYLLELQDRSTAKSTKRKRRKKKQQKGRNTFDCDPDRNEVDDEEKAAEFMKQQTRFKSKRVQSEQKSMKKKKKRRRRRDKDADPGPIGPSIPQNAKQRLNGNGNVTVSAPIRSECKACRQMFGSKSKLFEHLKLFPKHALISRHQR